MHSNEVSTPSPHIPYNWNWKTTASHTVVMQNRFCTQIPSDSEDFSVFFFALQFGRGVINTTHTSSTFPNDEIFIQSFRMEIIR